MKLPLGSEIGPYLCFCLSDVDLNLLETTKELLGVHLVVSIEAVKVSEDSSQSPDGLSTSAIDLSSHLLKNFTHAQ